MKRQKTIFVVLLSAALIGLQSCDDKLNKSTNTEELVESEKEVAIEIQQEKVNLQYIEPIFANENSEFSQGDYIQSMPQKVKAIKLSASEEGDTIKSADEIPVYTSENINEKIYIDGAYKYQSLNTTPADSSIFNALNVEIQPAQEVVAKTVVKDGTTYLYNKNNEIIQTEQSGNINYSSMLDSIKSALASEKQNSSSAQGVKAMQSRRLTKAISSAKASGMQMVSQSSNEIIMEMNLGSTSESSLPQRVKSSVQKKAVMRFSSDMTRMMEQKIYENNQLVQSVAYEYQEDNQSFAKKAPAVVRNLLPSSSVKGVTYKSLMLKNNGTPYILVRKENYKKNQVTINL